jgi:hypothetical protein
LHPTEHFSEFSLPVFFTSVRCLAVLNFGNLLDHEYPSFQGCYTVLASKHLLTFQMTVPPSKYRELLNSQYSLTTQTTWIFSNTNMAT